MPQPRSSAGPARSTAAKRSTGAPKPRAGAAAKRGSNGAGPAKTTTKAAAAKAAAAKGPAAKSAAAKRPAAKSTAAKTTAAKSAAAKRPAAKTTAAKSTAAKSTAATRPAANSAAAKRPAAKTATARSAAVRGTTAKSQAAKSAAAKRPAAKTTAAKTAAAKGATAKRTSAPQTAATKAAAKLAPPSARARAAGAHPSADETIAANVNAVRDFLTRGVLLTAERLQETLDDAVSRGRLTSTDADDILQRLVKLGRSQADEIRAELELVRAEIESLLEQSPSDVLNASLRAGTQLTPDRVVRELDRVRRVVGIGPAFPILAYDDLGAAQIIERLEDLNSAQLRKVRDRERRTAKRKTVLDAIERELR